MVYIAELFWWFEVMRPDFVKPKDLQDIKEGQKYTFNGILYKIHFVFILLFCDAKYVCIPYKMSKTKTYYII